MAKPASFVGGKSSEPRGRRRHVVLLGGAFAGTIRHGGARRRFHIPRLLAYPRNANSAGLAMPPRFRRVTCRAPVAHSYRSGALE